MRRAGGLWSGQPTASRTRAKYGERIVDAGAVRCGGCMCAERETEDAGDLDSVTLHLIAQSGWQTR